MSITKDKVPIWRIRGVDDETRRLIKVYAAENRLKNIGEALGQIVKKALSK
jgi:hypothetical protein